MEVYNGGDLDFNLCGVPSADRRGMWMQHFDLSATTVLHAAAFIAGTFGLMGLHNEMMQLELS